MKLPVKLSHTLHKSGGRITRITRIEHVIAKPEDGYSRDVWHYIGDVDWRDGGRSRNLEIAPWALCMDGEHRAEIDALSTLMLSYLEKHGRWCAGSTKHAGWYANRAKAAS